MFRALALPAFLVLFTLSIGGVARASEFEVAEPTIDAAPFDRHGPKIASDGDGFLVVWAESRANRGSVRAARLDSTGAVLDEVGIVVADGVFAESVAVVWASTEYVLAYGCGPHMNDPAVCLSRVNRDGIVRQLGARVAPALRPALAWNGRELLLAVAESNSISGSRENLFAHRFTFDGVRLAERLSLGVGFESAVASAGDHFFAVWAMDGAFGRLIKSDGSLGPVATLARSNGRHGLRFIDIASNGSDYLMAWAEAGSDWSTSIVRGRRISRAGEQGETFVIGSSRPVNIFPKVAGEGAGYVVTYTASAKPRPSGGDVVAARVAAEGGVNSTLALESEEREAGQSVIASNGARVVAAWMAYGGDFYYNETRAQIRVAPLSNTPQVATTVSRSTRWQQEPIAATIDGQSYVAWSEILAESNRRAVFVKPVEGAGRGSAVRESSANQLHPVISAGVDSSLVFWLEVTGDRPRARLFVRRLSRNGDLVGDAVVAAGEVGVSALAAISIGDQHTVFFQSINRRIAMIRFSGDARPLDPFPIDITQPRGTHWVGDIDPSAATDGSKVLLSWKPLALCSGVCPGLGPFSGLAVALISTGGTLLSSPVDVAPYISLDSAVAWNGTEYALFWFGTPNVPVRSPMGLYGQRIDRNGERVGVPVTFGVGYVRSGGLSWNGLEYVLGATGGWWPERTRKASVLRISPDLQRVRTVPLDITDEDRSSPVVLSLPGGRTLVLYERIVTAWPHLGISRITGRYLDVPLPRTRTVGRR